MNCLRHLFNARCIASEFAHLRFPFFLAGSRHFITKQKKETDKEDFLDACEELIDPEEEAAKEAEIEKKRNKSGLFSPDYNKQHDRVPYEKPQFVFQETLKYRRRTYGKYGESSKVNPSILWPSREELQAIKEYSGVLQPFSVQELIANSNEKKKLEEQKRTEKENEILQRVNIVKKEIQAFHKRVAAQKEEANALKEKKNKLIEEVRRHFGYKIDVRDQRFKDMLEEKQKEEKKQAKAAKKEKRQQKLTALKEQMSASAEKDESSVKIENKD